MELRNEAERQPAEWSKWGDGALGKMAQN